MPPSAEILARGPWAPSEIEIAWRTEPFQPDAATNAEADRRLDQLRERGSPSYDGFAARMVSFEAGPTGLRLVLEPIRWALRLLSDGAADSVSALCIVRAADGSWLAGRRAGWVASWAGRWALGAGGSVEVDENPTDTLARELEEEWGVRPERLQVEALIRLANGMVMFVGQAWLLAGATVRPDDEHDSFAWWPPAVEQWPSEADSPLRSIAALLHDPVS
ncbi:MAG TPA: NUDIX hydrolase [Solirubrobacteraceae bacterium]|nr:NUDIX hydrolase [Solirubrobacteraceae bacterium]